VVAWNSRKQQSVTLSTAEAETVAVSDALKDGIYLRHLMSELGVDGAEPIVVHQDSTASIAQVSNEETANRGRTKHLRIRHAWVRERVEAGEFRMLHVASKDNPADILTKGVGPKRFAVLKRILSGGEM